jgi:hypothetical protein
LRSCAFDHVQLSSRDDLQRNAHQYFESISRQQELTLEETTPTQKAAFNFPAPIAFSLPEVGLQGMPTGHLDFSDWNGALFLASPPFGMASTDSLSSSITSALLPLGICRAN